MVEAGELDGADVELTVRRSLEGLVGARDGEGESIFPLPPGARVDTLLLGCTHYPLLRPVLARVVGERVAIVDSATATAGALAELLAVNGLEAPGTTRGTAADAGRAGHERPDERVPRSSHRLFTTGDVAAFERVARRLFGPEIPAAEPVELGDRGPAAALR